MLGPLYRTKKMTLMASTPVSSDKMFIKRSVRFSKPVNYEATFLLASVRKMHILSFQRLKACCRQHFAEQLLDRGSDDNVDQIHLVVLRSA